jgi:hypothetical protein
MSTNAHKQNRSAPTSHCVRIRAMSIRTYRPILQELI